MSEERYELPEGWAWATVGDIVADARPGFASGKKGIEGGIRHLRMNNIGPNCRLDLSQLTTVPNNLAKERHFLKPGDVLFCHTNSQKLVGKTALFDIQDGSYAYSNHLTRLRLPSDGPPPQWLSYILATLWRDRYFETRCKQWVNQATVERDALLSTPIPVGPLKEQQRIVAKIEALFEQSRTARQALDRIPPLLKKFHQSVLAAAFRGDLTRDWREQHPDIEPAAVLLERLRTERRRKWEEDLRAKGKDSRKAKYEEPNPVDTSNLPELPERWVWCTLHECTTLITKGESPKWQGYQYVTDGVPFVRSENVLWGALDLSNVTRIPDTFHQKLQRSRLRPNDVLINLVGASIGRCAIVPQELREANINQAVATIRTTEALSQLYLLYLLLSPATQEDIQGKKVEVARPNISLGDLSGLIIPLAPIAEQQHIASSIDELFAQAAAIESAVEAARRRAEKLEQSIQARAFRGELVSQDPNDEPASALLDRIRAKLELNAGSRNTYDSRSRGEGNEG